METKRSIQRSLAWLGNIETMESINNLTKVVFMGCLGIVAYHAILKRQ